jgi:hypothetical protein
MFQAEEVRFLIKLSGIKKKKVLFTKIKIFMEKEALTMYLLEKIAQEESQNGPRKKKK